VLDPVYVNVRCRRMQVVVATCAVAGSLGLDARSQDAAIS
jgi:hypothetical protein